jgi:hypothetical protein
LDFHTHWSHADNLIMEGEAGRRRDVDNSEWELKNIAKDGIIMGRIGQ